MPNRVTSPLFFRSFFRPASKPAKICAGFLATWPAYRPVAGSAP